MSDLSSSSITDPLEGFVRIREEDYDRFTSAAGEWAKERVAKLTGEIIQQMQDCDAIGIFGDDIAVRDFWDEYSWNLIEGPYDNPTLMFGSSISGEFEAMARSRIEMAVDGLSPFEKMMLTMQAYDEIEDLADGLSCGLEEDGALLGITGEDAIAHLLLERINSIACARNLDLIGPYRGDIIGMHHSLTGIVGSAMEAYGLANEFLAENVDVFLYRRPEEISEAGQQLLEQYLKIVEEDLENSEGPAIDMVKLLSDRLHDELLEEHILPMLNQLAMDVERALE